MREVQPTQPVLNAAASVSTGATIKVKDYRFLLITFATATSANLTVKFQGSLAETAPTFSSAASVSNVWDYVAVRDLQSDNVIAGDTGVSVTGTDDVRQFLFHNNGLEHFCAQVTARSAGSVTVTVKGFN